LFYQVAESNRERENKMNTITAVPIQLFTLKQALKIEIDTELKMQLTREPALRIYKRLIADQAGIKVGRGLKGRVEALEIVESLLEQINERR
jgi:hypothetical protein